jgi:Lrp/AsnC family transcriptional regulator, leucine-responsive regulatory protein
LDLLSDATNRVILKELQDNAGISQVGLAEKVSLSQSSIALRLAKIVGSGLVTDPIIIDYEKLGLTMARVDLIAQDSRAVLNWAKKCPLCVNANSLLDESNLSLYFVAEDLPTLSGIIDEHLRTLDGVTNTDCRFITAWPMGGRMQMRLDLDVSRMDEPPCGISPFCPKCPRNPLYDGKVWAIGQD